MANEVDAMNQERVRNLGKFVPDPTCPACNGDKISKKYMAGWRRTLRRSGASWVDANNDEYMGGWNDKGERVGYLGWRCDECGCSWNTLSASGE